MKGTILLLFAMLLVPASSSLAQQRGDDADEKEVQAYRLTIGDIRRWHEINKRLTRLEKDHPELAKEEELADDASIDEIVRELDGVPEARNTIRAAGFTTREFVVLTFAYATAGMAYWAMGQGADLRKLAAEAGVDPANLAVFRDHEAELRHLQAELEALKTSPNQ